MDILEKAIKHEGGVSKLAQSLELAQSTVSMWRSRGVPAGWRKALELIYAKPGKPTRKPRTVGAA